MGNVIQIVPLNIWVCGNETLEIIHHDPINIVLKHDDPDYFIH